MHFRAITRIVGLLVILFSGTMIVPGLVALIYRDGAGRAFTQTFFVALAIGSMLWWPNRKQKGELKSREGFLIVVLFHYLYIKSLSEYSRRLFGKFYNQIDSKRHIA